MRSPVEARPRQAAIGRRAAPSVGRRLRRTILAAVGTALVGMVAIPASPVSAHAALETSVPAPSSVLEEAPSAVVLDFDEPIEVGLSSIELYDADQRPVEIGGPEGVSGDDSIVTAELPDLDAGVYAVVWRVASVDGHIVDGAFGFIIGTADLGGDVADSLVDQVSGGAAADDAVRRAADVFRFVLLVGLVLLVGSGTWSLLLPDDQLTGIRRRLPVIGWILSLVATLAGFALYGANAVAGTFGDAVSPDVWARIDGTQTGRMALVRVALLLVMGVLLRMRSASGTSWWRQVAVAAAIGVVVTLPAAGHPSAASPRALYVLLDAVHLVSVVAWMGGLALFAVGSRAWLDTEPVSRVVRMFSRSATVLVPVIVVTGALQTYELAGGIDTLTDTSWGRTLLVKLSLVSVVVAIGAVSRWLLQNVSAASIRRTVVAEALFGTVVLAFTASLVTLSPLAVAEARVFNASIAEAGLIADVTVTPGRVGANEMHLVLTPPGGSIQPVASVEARMSLPDRDVPTTPVTIVADGPNHYTGTIALAFSGEWTLELVIEVTPGNTLLLTTSVPIP
jgi:copper transport protein